MATTEKYVGTPVLRKEDPEFLTGQARYTDDLNTPPHWPLAKDKARYQGDGVAVVVAESRAAAIDAAEAVSVDYEALPAVTDSDAALADGAPIVHDDFG